MAEMLHYGRYGRPDERTNGRMDRETCQLKYYSRFFNFFSRCHSDAILIEPGDSLGSIGDCH